MEQRLEGQIAVVTGGTGVLGSRMCRALAEDGAQVVALGRDPDRGEAVADAIRTSGLRADFVSCDVLDEASLLDAHRTVLERHGPAHVLGIRVNAIAPGFFLTDQNRYLLTDRETGERTPRGDTILRRTPMARYGEPEDLDTALRFLVDPSSSFVTGVVVPVDGGFLAFSGV